MSKTRLEHIDSIRGLAALAVVYFHTAHSAMMNGQVTSVFEKCIFEALTVWVDLGKIAVVLFFAVSGFVIPFSLLKPRMDPMRSFCVTRFFRLYPAYWLSLAAALLLYSLWPEKQISLMQVLANITMLQKFLGYEDLLGVYWTLQIELIFYVICAVLFWFGVLNKPKWVCWASVFFLSSAVALAAVRFMLAKKLPVALPLSLCVMFWGVSWRYMLSLDTPQEKRLAVRLTGAIMALVPLISFLAYNTDLGHHETWYRYTFTYLIAMCLFMVLTTRVMITQRALVYLGTISYSVYLFGPISQEVAERAVTVGGKMAVPVHVVIAIALLLTIVIAGLVYRLIELPAIVLGRKLTTAPIRNESEARVVNISDSRHARS